MKKNDKTDEFISKYCCGCGFCSNYIDGAYDAQGFYRPNSVLIKEKFDVDLCYCNSFKDTVSDKLWGDFENLYYSYSTDNFVRKKASSGGTLTEVASYLLERGIVDYIIQIDSSDESKIKTQISISHTREEVINKSGSRYAASAVLKDIFKLIDKSNKYAIIGKPCDITVLRTFMNKNPEWNLSILYLLTFFCGGTPSYQANIELLKKMNLQEDQLSDFTYRGNGWPGKTTGLTKDGKVGTIDYEESWGKTLGRDLQNICRFCWDGVGSAADISCGDGWYIENGKPIFAERDGRNITFARTKKGDTLLNEMFRANKINLEVEKDIGILEQMQPGQYMRKVAMFSRISAMRLMGKSVPKYNMRQLYHYAKKISIMENLRMFYGTIKRVWRKKIK